MVEVIKKGFFLINGNQIVNENTRPDIDKNEATKGTITSKILTAHNTSGSNKNLKIKFDALASHDITYVGIVQTAKASGLKEFPIPYVLTNCHNSLCAVGGTINEDDHVFGLSAAKKYGGIFVPAHQAVIHQYVREMMTGCGKMLLGSDSHTRYGALGTMGIGEGGPELVKQLLSKTYDVPNPEVIAIYLEGTPKAGIGPQDIALAIIGAVFSDGYVKNKVLEFVGPGVAALSVDYRNGIDVMTTETTCLSSIWITDDKVKEYYKIHGREADYNTLQPENITYYDGLVKVDLSKMESMIAMPFHPSNIYTIKELNENAEEILNLIEEDGKKSYGSKISKFDLKSKFKDGKIHVDQGVIAGCSGGTFENVRLAAKMLTGRTTGDGAFNLSVYPASQPVFLELVKDGSIAQLIEAGATIRSAICGPCFGAGDVPCNNGFSIRHTTRNFPNREGSRPSDGQISWVALMDARSIAATALNGGILTAATDLAMPEIEGTYTFDKKVYDNRVYQGFGKADLNEELKFGPNIADWPKMSALTEDILLEVACVINDPVTTTDELIPSGETSSYRSNPMRLAEYTLSRKDPEYVGRAKEINKAEQARRAYITGITDTSTVEILTEAYKGLNADIKILAKNTGIGSVVFAIKPGDGSAREQAASCQKVLGGWANIAAEYATKRYRSNLINWGMLPFITEDHEKLALNNGDRILVKDIKNAVQQGKESVNAFIYRLDGKIDSTQLKLPALSKDDRDIILAGCLINYYSRK